MTPDQLRALVATMRELGVLEADGVKLGPVPPKHEDLARAAAAEKDPAVKKQLQIEAEKADRERRLDEWRADTANLLAASGATYSVEQLDRMRPPPADLL